MGDVELLSMLMWSATVAFKGMVSSRGSDKKYRVVIRFLVKRAIISANFCKYICICLYRITLVVSDSLRLIGVNPTPTEIGDQNRYGVSVLVMPIDYPSRKTATRNSMSTKVRVSPTDN